MKKLILSTTALLAKSSKNKDMSAYASRRRHLYITNIFKYGKRVYLFPTQVCLFRWQKNLIHL